CLCRRALASSRAPSWNWSWRRGGIRLWLWWRRRRGSAALRGGLRGGRLVQHLLLDSFLPADGRTQLVWHAGHHHSALEEQPALQPQRGLVVQQLLPPVSEYVLGDVNGHDIVRVLGAQALDVVDDRPGDLSIRRGDDCQRDRDVPLFPVA